MFLPTAPEVARNRDTHFLYRYDSYFYHLTGFEEPESVLMVVAGAQPRTILFCREKDMEREIWDGFRYGPEAAKSMFGVDEAYPISMLDDIAQKVMANQSKLFYPFGIDAHWMTKVSGWLASLTAQSRTGVFAPRELHDAKLLLDELRLYKDATELDTMRKAATISCGAHARAMRFARPGKTEFEVEAELLHEFRRLGSQAPAYNSIVAAGANACVLHYVFNNATLADGDLLLIDAGCELDGYASDITRTFPVNGKFSAAQKDVYELVLAAQAAAIEKVTLGNHWNAPHEAALDVLVRGLIDFGLCKGTPEAVLESGAYRQFYMHRTGHWLGLDVHDAGEYKRDGEWRALEPRMVLTVEPGCYIRPAENVPEHFWNIGIRIEDDAVVTSGGPEIITASAPKTVAEIEAVMAEQ